jgi:hypothetical protein
MSLVYAKNEASSGMFYSLCHDFGSVKEYLLTPC